MLFTEVAQQLIENGRATFKKTELLISAPSSADNVKELSSDEDNAATEIVDTVQVSNVPTSLMKRETLLMFFENVRRSGGGDIKELGLNESTARAVITFKDPQGVQFNCTCLLFSYSDLCVGWSVFCNLWLL